MIQAQGDNNIVQNTVESKRLVSLEGLSPIRAYVEVAFKSDDGDLALIGWLFDPENHVRGLSVLEATHEGLLKRPAYRQQPVEHGVAKVQFLRVERPDVTQALSEAGKTRGNRHGVVLVIPKFPAKGRLALALDDGRFADLPFEILKDTDEINRALENCWRHSGAALNTALYKAFGPDSQLTRLAASFGADNQGQTGQTAHYRFATCDQAFLLNGRVLILNGWIAKPKGEVSSIELSMGPGKSDISSRIKRYPRPDLTLAYPWSGGEALGFLAVLDVPANSLRSVSLEISCHSGQVEQLSRKILDIDWTGLGRLLNQQGDLTEPLLGLLSGMAGLEDGAEGLNKRLALLRQASFLARYAELPAIVEQPETVMAVVDRAYALGEAGLLLFGWRVTPKRKPAAVTVRAPGGQAVEISGRMFSLSRQDVAQGYRKTFPGVDEWCGFVCLAPIPTRTGEERALCFDFGDLGEVWLKLSTENMTSGGAGLIREILGSITAPERIRHSLYDLFNCGLGQAIEAVSRSRQPFAGPVEERQFGTAPEAAEVSVVVPLYGRYDFLRYQLAEFVDDPDFGSVDLIYVVDDPGILSQTLELASKYYPLFEAPFRIAWYGQNRGFAGANNIGASIARGKYLLLMNSDVLPQRPGWLTALRTALDTLPGAGAVGPLLEFGDGSIQHAGMYPRRDPLFPGFLLNTHKGMGMAWNGDETPSEHPMLTAACLMLRKADYLELGGLDEGYLVGDFEDADLCLALRKQGKRLWLEPKARLWHLERLSQGLDDTVDVRQLLTLFNGWRYNEKIRRGVIADPMQGEI